MRQPRVTALLATLVFASLLATAQAAVASPSPMAQSALDKAEVLEQVIAPVEEDAYESAKEIARQALNQALPDQTGGALYFHDRSVQPDWAAVFPLTAETDIFLFYRPSGGAAR